MFTSNLDSVIMTLNCLPFLTSNQLQFVQNANIFLCRLIFEISYGEASKNVFFFFGKRIRERILAISYKEALSVRNLSLGS